MQVGVRVVKAQRECQVDPIEMCASTDIYYQIRTRAQYNFNVSSSHYVAADAHN